MFNEVLAILEKYSDIRYEKAENLIRVLPRLRDGFEVVIEQIWENHFSVSCDRWHEDFYNFEEALDCFFLGLSNRCRVKVQSKDGAPFRWTVEYLDDTDWHERSTNSVWTYRFLSSPTTSYLQNDLLSESDVHPIITKLGARLLQTGGK
jgi:hypothetical protein